MSTVSRTGFGRAPDRAAGRPPTGIASDADLGASAGAAEKLHIEKGSHEIPVDTR